MHLVRGPTLSGLVEPNVHRLFASSRGRFGHLLVHGQGALLVFRSFLLSLLEHILSGVGQSGQFLVSFCCKSNRSNTVSFERAQTMLINTNLSQQSATLEFCRESPFGRQYPRFGRAVFVNLDITS